MKNLLLAAALFGVSAQGAETVPTAEQLRAAEQRVDAQFPYLARKRDARKGEVELGAKLFFDPRLSSSGAMSCATCHQPSQTMTDGLPRAVGLGHKVLKRNTPSLTGGRYRKFFFWDGRARSVEEAAMTALQNTEEMNQTLPGLEKILASLPGYVESFAAVYGPGSPRHADAASAMAAFVESLVTFESAFDRFHERGVPMPPAAQRGLVLFTGKAGCVRCHATSNFSSEAYYNLGLPASKPEDLGHLTVSGKAGDRGAFRVPSLRNVALTGPYMHDGSLRSLREVVDFFDRGGPGFDRLGLEEGEKNDLIAFLEALSSPPGAVVPPRLPLESGAAPSSSAAAPEDRIGADETLALAEWDRLAGAIERRLTERELLAAWSPKLPPPVAGRCAESVDELLRRASAENWREKDRLFFDGVFLAAARRYYLFSAVAESNPERCAPLAAFPFGLEEGVSFEGSCREFYHEMRFAQVLGVRGPKSEAVCAESMAHQKSLGAADARELCAALSRADDPAKACARFQPKYLDRHQIPACENGMRIYAGDPETCANTADLAAHLAERCEVYPLFRAASRAGDASLCGSSQRCRVLMGGGREAAALVEKSLLARACGRTASPPADADAALKKELDLAQRLVERFAAPRRDSRAARLAAWKARRAS